MCTQAAPASADSIAESAISAGVTGSPGCCSRVVMLPAIAHETISGLASFSSRLMYAPRFPKSKASEVKKGTHEASPSWKRQPTGDMCAGFVSSLVDLPVASARYEASMEFATVLETSVVAKPNCGPNLAVFCAA